MFYAALIYRPSIVIARKAKQSGDSAADRFVAALLAMTERHVGFSKLKVSVVSS
jgi:hypothetical protein